MTGLDVDRHVIVEIATLVTDDELRIVAEGPDLVVATDPGPPSGRMDHFVRDMHTQSGLLDEITASTVALEDAGAATLDFIRAHVPKPRTVPLAGNSIGTDRRFLAAYLPEIEEYLHYRSVDVSTVKELAQRWYPGGGGRRPDQGRRPPGHGRHPGERGRAGLLPVGRLPGPRRPGRRGAERNRREATAAPRHAGRGPPTTPRRPAGTEATASLDRPGPAPSRWRSWPSGACPPGPGSTPPPTLRTVLELSSLHGDKDFLVYEDERLHASPSTSGSPPPSATP